MRLASFLEGADKNAGTMVNFNGGGCERWSCSIEISFALEFRDVFVAAFCKDCSNRDGGSSAKAIDETNGNENALSAKSNRTGDFMRTPKR
jgi:hypothetical protein